MLAVSLPPDSVEVIFSGCGVARQDIADNLGTRGPVRTSETVSPLVFPVLPRPAATTPVLGER